MNITLTITGSAATLARVLSLLDGQTVALAAAEPDDTDQIELPLTVAPVQAVETPVMPEVSAAAPTVPGEPQFDSSGLAWDERIHSAQRGTTNDGRWRKRRNVDDAVYNAVEAELRARYGKPASVTASSEVVAMPTPPMPVPVMPMPMPMPTVNDEGNDDTPIMSAAPADTAHGAVAAVSAASEPVAVTPVPVAAPAQAQQTVDFHTVMGIVGTRMANNTINPDYLVGLVAEINGQLGTQMQSFTDMAALPHAVQYAYSAMVRDGKA